MYGRGLLVHSVQCYSFVSASGTNALTQLWGKKVFGLFVKWQSIVMKASQAFKVLCPLKSKEKLHA